MRIRQAENFRMPPLQQENYVVQNAPEAQKPQHLNPKLDSWLQNNPWYGPEPEMTALAVGVDKNFEKQAIL
jgi:hypothetical protein